MAERFLTIENLLTANGYECEESIHPKMSSFVTLHSKTGDVLFGVGILDDCLAIVRYSHLDGNDGSIAVVSIMADISAIIRAIELLAKGAMYAA